MKTENKIIGNKLFTIMVIGTMFIMVSPLIGSYLWLNLECESISIEIQHDRRNGVNTITTYNCDIEHQKSSVSLREGIR